MSDGEKCKGCRNGEDFPVPFSMAFQPIVDVIDKRIYSYEAPRPRTGRRKRGQCPRKGYTGEPLHI